MLPPNLRNRSPMAYKKMQGVSGSPSGSTVPFCSLLLYPTWTFLFYHMILSSSCLLSILPFLVTAIPLADPASHGIAIPIAKRISPSRPFADCSLYASQVQNSFVKIKRGMVAYERNTGEPHPLSSGIETSSTGKRDTGSVPLANENALLWFGTISVGTPAQTFTVDFDTGSSDLFLPSTDCDSSCLGHNAYNASASSSSRDLNKTFELNYGDGSATKGKQYTDNVIISDQIANSQTLGAATKYSGFEISRFLPDGLMGMAFQSISVFNASPPFQTIVSQNQEISPIFGFKLALSDSELFLGGVNNNLYRGDISWVNLTNQDYWRAPVDSITVSRDGHERIVRENFEAIFDTGTTMIVGDRLGIDAFYAELSSLRTDRSPKYYGGGLYTIPCDFNTSISVSCGGKLISISPDTFNLGPIRENSKRCIAGAAWLEQLTGEFWIVGDVFLRNTYSAWDVGNGRIGFADLA